MRAFHPCQLFIAGTVALSAGCLEGTPGFGEYIEPGCGNGESEDGEFCLGDERQLLLGRDTPSLTLTRLQTDAQLDGVAVHPDGATLYLNLGRSFPTALPLPVAGDVRAARFVDVTGDGLLDLALAIQDSDPADPMAPTEDRIVVLSQTTDAPPTFTLLTTQAIPAGPRDLLSADVTGDGLEDLIVACETAGVVAVLGAVGDGTLRAAVTYPAGVGPRSMAVGDVDGDGRNDIAVAPFAANQVGLLRATDAGFGLGEPLIVGIGPSAIRFVDLDGDSADDLVVANEGSAQMWVFLAGGAETWGRFGPPVVSDAGGPAVAISVVDLNRDSTKDLLTANGDPATLSRMIGAGDGTFEVTPIEVSGSVRAVSAADGNADEQPDIVIGKAGAGAGFSVLLTAP